jgi:hypothetical protein
MRNFALQSKGSIIPINAVVLTGMSRYPAITKVMHHLRDASPLRSWKWPYFTIHWPPDKSRLADYSREISDSLLLLLTEDVLRIMIQTDQRDGKCGYLWAVEGEVEYISNVEWILGTMGMNKHQRSHIRYSSPTYECTIITGLTFAGSHCGTASGLSLYNTSIQQHHLGKWWLDQVSWIFRPIC